MGEQAVEAGHGPSAEVSDVPIDQQIRVLVVRLRRSRLGDAVAAIALVAAVVLLALLLVGTLR